MTTTPKDSQAAMGYGPHLIQAVLDETRINVTVYEPNKNAMASFYVPDFIAAVETELNGIFISHDELPEVISGQYDGELAVLDSNGEKSTMAVTSDTPESLREIGLAFLAMASYREKNPPGIIDQKQVDALAQILDEKIISHEMPGDIARRLLASGKITVRTV